MKKILSIVVLVSLGLGNSSQALSISCKQAKEWVDSHADHLPTTLAEMNGLHVAYRREVFGRLSEDKKISLWKEHFKSQSYKLNEKQLAELKRIEALLKPGIMKKSSAELAKILPTAKDEYVIFGEENTRSLFTVLGTFDKTQLNEADILAFFPSLKNKQAANRKIASYDSGGDDGDGDGGLKSCNCSTAAFNNFCSSGQMCDGTDGTCNPSSYVGCGFMWMMPCTGRCTRGAE